MPPVSYGLWQRCENTNITIMKQGISLGTRLNVQICRPNRYMRYSVENFETCYNIRRNCPVMDAGQLPAGCYCRYLPSARALQWMTILAAVFLVIGLLIFYLKNIATAQNGSFLRKNIHGEIFFSLNLGSAALILNYGPFVCFVLALLLMVTTLIVLGACKFVSFSTKQKDIAFVFFFL